MRRPPLNSVITNQAFQDLENRDYCLCEGVCLCVYVCVSLCVRKRQRQRKGESTPLCLFVSVHDVTLLFFFCPLLSSFTLISVSSPHLLCFPMFSFFASFFTGLFFFSSLISFLSPVPFIYDSPLPLLASLCATLLPI